MIERLSGALDDETGRREEPPDRRRIFRVQNGLAVVRERLR
ncbi:MAG: hypothetical protein PVI57_09525 [Gemmatimonadota bacterium]|jgi:hypothetical protein